MLDITLEETRVYREVKEEAEQKGCKQGAVNTVTKLLTKRFGALESNIQESIFDLSPADLDSLIESILDFENKDELKDWLRQQRRP